MGAKKRVDTHVPGITEVINAPSSGSSPHSTTPDNATEPVTLATLAGDIEGIKDQIAIMVEWLETLDERLTSEN